MTCRDGSADTARTCNPGGFDTLAGVRARSRWLISTSRPGVRRPDDPSATANRHTSGAVLSRESGIEHPFHGGAGPARGPQVVVHELARVAAAEQPHRRRPAPPRAGAAGRRAGPGPASARCGPGPPASSRRPSRRRPRGRPGPASRAAASASRVRVLRSSGTAYACRSCSSCTAHSTSARPPRPSLVWVAGSAPRGSRSVSTRALIRRISTTCSRLSPPRRIAHPVGERLELACPGPRRRRRTGPAAAPAPPTPSTSGRSTGRTRRGCAPAAPAGPRGAGRRRRPAAGRAPACRAAGAAPRRSRARRRWPRRPATPAGGA